MFTFQAAAAVVWYRPKTVMKIDEQVIWYECPTMGACSACNGDSLLLSSDHTLTLDRLSNVSG